MFHTSHKAARAEQKVDLLQRLSSGLRAQEEDEDDGNEIATENPEPEFPPDICQADGSSEDGDEGHQPLSKARESTSNVSILERRNLRAVKPHATLPRVAEDEEEHEDDADTGPLDRGGCRHGLEHREDEDQHGHDAGAVHQH